MNGETWRLKVRHVTGFRYDSAVSASYNEARMTPLSDGGQTTLESRVSINPRAAVSRYVDYWGSHVVAFDLQSPHTELTVEAVSVVETHPSLAGGDTVDWETLRDPRTQDTHVEFLLPTPHTHVADDLAAAARGIAADLEPGQAAYAVSDWMRSQVAYVPGATGVHTVAMEAWAERKGVCQDLAHLTVGALRSLGIPARYVSGYLHNREAALGETVTGESHAWVQWWDGEWTSFDPTNGKPVGPEHVVVARGRDYWDVPPHKGVYSGAAATALGVEVQVTRLA
ncbi:MAG: transglutaminase family protein [Sporichthyaceae bacterium]